MTFFEGSMYLWIFLQFPALEFAHEEGGWGDTMSFGIIFAAMMLPRSRWVVTTSKLLALTLIIASICFIIPTLYHNEAVTFWCFCIFEVCCGIYFPSVAHLRERIIEDHIRARVSSVLRIPLNLFVVIGLVSNREEIVKLMKSRLGRQHRENVFGICSVGLLSAATILGVLGTDE
ncbi:hypothetical protein HYALB_00001976 [Hymenoscyphus albidus]|uniref:Molybdate-anion transporter n=1 Tax=Hymenoscyphus albidus TaxID=595503 RepID=A0A9N9Q1N4_9HELO|nr:hypothetical protein HYALB_00001976 [Hymenoscyphus albidus]